MVNPDNTINSKSDIKRNSDKVASDKPDGEVRPEKFREVYAVYEQKKPKDEFEELDDVLKKKRKGGKGIADIFESATADKPVFNLKESKEKDFDDEFENEMEKIAAGTDGKTAKPAKQDFYLSEHQDLSQVNPLGQPVPEIINTNLSQSVEKPMPPTRNDLQEIIDKIVNQVYKLENSKTGESSIVIILNKDGPLKDVGIKISEFDSANKQVNITVDNLTQEAKHLLEKAESQLLLALERKGYQVQMLTTTTTVDILRIEQSGKPDGQKGNSEENPRDRKHREENPEEE